MSLFFTGKLLKVESNMNDKKELTHRLVFASTKYDKGLEQVVPCSQSIKLHEDDFKYLEVFKTFVGKDISVPVDFSTTMNGMNVFFKTTGEGYRLFEDVTNKSTQLKASA